MWERNVNTRGYVTSLTTLWKCELKIKTEKITATDWGQYTESAASFVPDQQFCLFPLVQWLETFSHTLKLYSQQFREHFFLHSTWIS